MSFNKQSFIYLFSSLDFSKDEELPKMRVKMSLFRPTAFTL